MSFPAYEQYAPSGIDWLPDTPSHWKSGQLRWLATLYAGGTPDKKNESYWTDGAIPWLNSGAVNQQLIAQPSAYISDEALENSSAKWVPENALVIALAGQGKTKGMVAQVAFDTTCNQSMAAIIPNSRLHPRYLLWWLSSNYQNIRNLSGGDLRDGLNLQLLGTIGCPLPKADEQKAISSFLDVETSKIDGLVSEQRRLIELLKEKRQAVISHAVTKGLNPNAPMKPSGIQWLGDVPQHWELMRLRHIVELNPPKSETAELDRKMNVSFLPMQRIGDDGTIDTSQVKSLREVENGYTYFRNGDVAVAKITPCFENGKGAVMSKLLNGIGFGTTELIVARPQQGRLLAEYLHLVFISSPFRLMGESHMYGAGGQKRVPDDFIRDFIAPIPSPVTQAEVVEFVRSATARLDTLIAEAERAIELLQERRTALISAAVTGKIDVRTYAPQEAVV